MRRPVFAVLAAAILLALAGCKAADAPAQSAATPAFSAAQPEAAPAGTLQFFGSKGPTNANIAAGESGVYYIRPCSDGFANLAYIDFSSRTSVPLCSRPECTHSDETCTAYLGWRGGNPYRAKNDTQLILVYANALEENLQKYGDAALPNIQTADLNGENRRTICQFSASDNLLPGLACDGQFLYCVLVRMNGTSQENVIVRVALA